jgi:hypothetical protein
MRKSKQKEEFWLSFFYFFDFAVNFYSSIIRSFRFDSPLAVEEIPHRFPGNAQSALGVEFFPLHPEGGKEPDAAFFVGQIVVFLYLGAVLIRIEDGPESDRIHQVLDYIAQYRRILHIAPLYGHGLEQGLVETIHIGVHFPGYIIALAGKVRVGPMLLRTGMGLNGPPFHVNLRMGLNEFTVIFIALFTKRTFIIIKKPHNSHNSPLI